MHDTLEYVIITEKGKHYRNVLTKSLKKTVSPWMMNLKIIEKKSLVHIAQCQAGLVLSKTALPILIFAVRRKRKIKIKKNRHTCTLTEENCILFYLTTIYLLIGLKV